MLARSEIIYRIAAVTGLPLPAVIGVHRRLVETGTWPPSRGPGVAALNISHLVLLLLALLSDVPAKDAASAAASYYSLEDSDGNKLGEVLCSLIDNFTNLNEPAIAAMAYKSRIEIDCGLPRANVSIQTIDGQSETLFGLLNAKWSDLRIRHSMTISGKVLFDLAMGWHFNRWESAALAA